MFQSKKYFKMRSFVILAEMSEISWGIFSYSFTMRDLEVKNTENHCSKQSIFASGCRTDSYKVHPVVSGLFTSIESSIITKHYGP